MKRRALATAGARFFSPRVSWKNPGRMCFSLCRLPRRSKNCSWGLRCTTKSEPEINNCVGTWIAWASATTRSAASYRPSSTFTEMALVINGSLS
ncbi:hypothetical protein D9M68_981820 [compost metagenome]